MAFVKYRDIKDEQFDQSNYLQTGINGIDKSIIGLGMGQLIVVTGTRAGGKTTLIGQITNNFIDKGYSGLLCSFEMKNSRLKRWLNLQALGKNNLKKEITVTGKEIYEPKNDFVKEKVESWIDKHLEVYDNSSFNVNKVSADIIERLEENPEIKFVILDNLMKLDTDTMNENKYEAQSRLVKRLQVFAQKNNICLILVAHPNKIRVLPRIEDVGGSGDIINIADTVLLVHRVTDDFKIRAKEYFQWEFDNPIYKYSNIIEIAKDREFGMDGSLCGVYFEPEAKRFLNYENENHHYGWEEKPKQSRIELTPIDDTDDELFGKPF